MKRAIELAAKAYLEAHKKLIYTPERIEIENEHGTMLYKPAYSKNSNLFVT